MRKSLIILLIVFSAAVIADDKVINKQFDFDDSFVLNKINFTMDFYESSEKLFVKSPYLKLIMIEGDCETKGYYKFCLRNVTNDESELDFFFWFEVFELSCVNQTKLQLGDDCKFKFSHNCTDDSECASGTCYRNICTYTTPICGDGFCDGKERCEEDCIPKINETEVNVSVNESEVNLTMELNETPYVNESEINLTVEVDDINATDVNQTEEVNTTQTNISEESTSQVEHVVDTIAENLPDLEDKNLNPIPKMKPLTWAFIIFGIIMVSVVTFFVVKYLRKDKF